ncbi:MAG: hypothetical protein LBS51_04430 [Oscillospiraceae bacterium]|jgi:hypothetical protein|nr:hypothetical protein [Oscillospiraceae bacterium]
MKKSGLWQRLFPAAALTLAIGAAAVLGNGWVMSRTLAVNISAESPASVSGEAAETAHPAANVHETKLPDEDGIGTIVKTLENGTSIFVSYVRDDENPETTVTLTYDYGDGRTELYSYEGEAAAAVIERFGGPKRDGLSGYEKGQPGENDITRDEAVFTALNALTDKYALRRETLDRFSVTAEFYAAYEELADPVWRVYLYPADADEFPEIGCYTALIDTKTGDAARLLSAADGRG